MSAQFLLLIQNPDTRQRNFRRTIQHGAENLANYLAQTDLFDHDEEMLHKIYHFAQQATAGQHVTVHGGVCGRRAIEIYALGEHAVG